MTMMVMKPCTVLFCLSVYGTAYVTIQQQEAQHVLLSIVTKGVYVRSEKWVPSTTSGCHCQTVFPSRRPMGARPPGGGYPPPNYTIMGRPFSRRFSHQIGKPPALLISPPKNLKKYNSTVY